MGKRVRGRIAGGYTRKTLSLPTSLVEDIEKILAQQPGVTISVFATVALDTAVNNAKRRS